MYSYFMVVFGTVELFPSGDKYPLYWYSAHPVGLLLLNPSQNALFLYQQA